MKKIIYLLLILPSLFITCKKKDEVDLSQYKASGYLLGDIWQASNVNFSLEYNNTIWFNLSKYNELHELRQQIGLLNLNVSQDTIFLKPWEKGATLDSIIKPGAYFSTFLSDGDLLGDRYKLLEDGTFKNWVLIKKVSDNEISGKFQVAFVIKDRLYADRKTLPDTLYFTNVEFLARRR